MVIVVWQNSNTENFILFQFERIPRTSKTSEMFSESLTTNTTSFEESRDINIDLKKETTFVSDRSFLSDIQSNMVQTPEKSAKSKVSHKGGSRRDSSSHSDNDLDSPKNSSVPKSKHISGKHNPQNSSKSPTLDQVIGSKLSKDSVKDTCPEPLPHQDSREVDDESEKDRETKKKKKVMKKGKIR